MQTNYINRKVINPIVGLLLILRDANTKAFDSLLSKLPNQNTHQIISILRDQDPDLAKSIEVSLKGAGAMIEEKKKEVPKEKEKKPIIYQPLKTPSAIDLYSLLSGRSDAEIYEALPQIKENPGSFYPSDPKTSNLFTRTIEAIFKIINSHIKVLKLCAEAYYTLSELIIHNPDKVEKVYELVVYTCLGIADKNEKVPYIWDGAMQVIRALLLTDSASATYQYIIKSIEYSVNSHAYIRALAALPSTLDKDFVEAHLKSLTEALKKVQCLKRALKTKKLMSGRRQCIALWNTL
jgi:hypothetical protein